MDDRGIGPATVAHLRPDADRRGSYPRVSSGNTLFTLLGFMGLYTLLSVLFLFLIYHEIERGRNPTFLPCARSRPRSLPEAPKETTWERFGFAWWL